VSSLPERHNRTDAPAPEPFKQRLARGLSVERLVGHDLFELGYWVSWPNPPKRALGEEAGFDVREPDLVVLLRAGPLGLEVKGRRISFSGPGDFPHKLALVGSVARWESRRDDPWAVVLVSRTPKAGRIVIPCRTRHRWEVITVRGEPSLGVPKDCWRSWDWLIERLAHPVA
jgi:hypothetical protein